MTQKQLQGDWEGKAKQWDELQPFHFSFKESSPESAASSPDFDQKLSKTTAATARELARQNARLQLTLWLLRFSLPVNL